MKIKDIVQKIVDNRGKTPPLNKKSGIPLIEAQTYVNSILYINNDDAIKFVDDQTYNTWFRNGHPQKDDLLITLVGDLGSCCLVGEEKCCIAQNIIALRFNELANPKYIYYLFQTSYYKKIIKSLNRSSVQPSILVSDLLELNIDLPNINEQNKIANLLSALDEYINNCFEMNKKIDVFENIIFNQYFKKSTIDISLKDIITIDRGISYTSKDIESNIGIPMISLNSFNPNNTFKLNSEKTYSGKYNNNKVLKYNDLLMCVTQQTAIDLIHDTDVIGKVFLLPKIYENDVVATMDVIRLFIDEKYKYYVYLYFKQKYFHKYISNFANGTKIKHLDCNGFLNLIIKFPSNIEKFNDMIKELEEFKSNNLSLANINLKKRNKLLLLLMNKQITLK